MSSPRPPNVRLARAREILKAANCNLSPEHREIVARAGAAFNRGGQFGDSVMMQMRMIVCNTFERPEDGRTHARVVFEGTVLQEMCNAHNMMHGGCAAFLVDACTSATLVVQALVAGGAFDLVSQSLNTTFHAGAKLGDKLNVVCITVSSGKRAVSVRAEIWNTTARRLVATGSQVKMAPSRSDVKL
ncbi:HotDog domain-containing protein [Fomitopsis serialis]|uniref:HotDog domain-containing protein n=1 Tax=Fomitopsis serialis TaxID=139415 RepID=UPI002008864E|nr:HotDog domain-containing protein [Neoantrodia serialis]KAH9928186.1 HotDog domain-containing protein [Neoantrodia serialis]